MNEQDILKKYKLSEQEHDFYGAAAFHDPLGSLCAAAVHNPSVSL